MGHCISLFYPRHFAYQNSSLNHMILLKTAYLNLKGNPLRANRSLQI